MTSPRTSSPPDRAEGSRPELPAGVVVHALTCYADHRGTVAEIFRTDWPTGMAPAQWSATVTRRGVLRGVHVHVRHDDYLCVVQGHLTVGLRDLRPRSPTEELAMLLDLHGADPVALFIPHGVAHGLYTVEPSIYVLATSHHYDPADELGVHWTDPGIGIPWPVTTVAISARDDGLPPLRDVLPLIPPWSGG